MGPNVRYILKDLSYTYSSVYVSKGWITLERNMFVLEEMLKIKT